MGPLPKPSFSAYPLAVLAASFALGVLFADLFRPSPVWCLIASGAFALACLLFLRRQPAALATVFVALAFDCAGATLAAIEMNGARANGIERFYDEGLIAAGDPVEVTGVLVTAPEPSPDGFYLKLRVEELSFKGQSQAAQGVLWLFAVARDAGARALYEPLELRYGVRVRVMTALDRTESFRNPGVDSRTEFLERRGYDAAGIVKSPLLIERLDDERVLLPLAWLYEWRQSMMARINETFSPETAGVLLAALLGNRYYLSHSAAERFREAGTFHVLVISGLHISFIGGLALFLMRRVTKRRGWQFIASASLLWAYALAVGAEPSVMRAALMFTVMALGPLVARRAQPLNALGCAALLLLAWRPSELFDASFQLTFLSVLALCVIAWPLVRNLQAVGGWRPTQATPYPPACPHWWRTLAEALFWSERQWQRELSQTTYSCRLFKTPLAARLERWHVHRPLRYAASAIIVSMSVQVALLPVLVLYFHRLSLASLVLNILVGLMMAALSLLALATLSLSLLSLHLAMPLLWLAEHVNWLMVHSVDPFARLHVAAFRLPEYTGWMAGVYAFYYVPLIILAITLAGWNPLHNPETNAEDERLGWAHRLPRVAAVALMATLVMIIAHPSSGGGADGRLRIDFLDVGQGDAALLTMPDGTTLLIDGGGRPKFDALPTTDEAEGEEPFERDTRSIGDAVVSEYLWWRGLDHVDYLLATHADADHIDGLNDVVRNFHVRAALVGRAPAVDPEFARFSETLRAASVPLYLVGRGDVLRFGAVEAEVLWPIWTNDQSALSNNNDSLVLRVRCGSRTFLLTGDIEKEAEAALTSTGEDLRSDVVKVAHHGSRTSSTPLFVSLTRPKVAIVSVGLSSIFGHPHMEVIERWQDVGAEVLTTGRAGTISISTDGNDLKVETFVHD